MPSLEGLEHTYQRITDMVKDDLKPQCSDTVNGFLGLAEEALAAARKKGEFAKRDPFKGSWIFR